MPGILYLCATPIGNLGDMTYRAVQTLKEADLIAAEDTRNSVRLLQHFDIHVPMTSYHEFNKIEKGKKLVEKLLAGQTIVLISDAGMPGISDPGQELTQMCVKAGIRVSVLPGASAGLTALVMSGLSSRRFCFEGFLPSEKEDKKARSTVLDRLVSETRTTIFYEAPHRLIRTLEALQKTVGPERQIAICRELTKKHEEAFRGTLAQAIHYFDGNDPRGEFVLILEGASAAALEAEGQAAWQAVPLKEHVQMYLDQGMERKEAMKAAAKDRGLSKRDVYAQLLEQEGK